MEKITIETLKEKKGAVILIVVLFIACIWVFWPAGDPTPPPPPAGQNAAQDPAAPATNPTTGKTAGAPAAPPPPPARKISTGSS